MYAVGQVEISFTFFPTSVIFTYDHERQLCSGDIFSTQMGGSVVDSMIN